MKIKLYNKIAQCGLSQLPQGYEVAEDLAEEDGIAVRSADLHEASFPESLKAIARAGAGVNNIPLDVCTEKGIVVFNTPGANARAVIELCVAGLLLTSRKVFEGMEWAKTLQGREDALKVVEKEKSKFVGPEIYGKTLGVIGLGAIGGGVANAASALGMRVLGYDPYASVDAAWLLSPAVEKCEELSRIFAESDYITVHVPSLPSTRGILGGENIAKMKDGVRLLNLARADLAVDEDILAGLESGKIAAYYTDFPTGKLAGVPGVIATPHLGASTPEAEDNCAVMACRQLADYLENGNIKNSVNMPCIRLARGGKCRIGVFFRPEAEAEVQALLLGADMARGERGGVIYALCEREAGFDLEAIKKVGGVLRVISY